MKKTFINAEITVISMPEQIILDISSLDRDERGNIGDLDNGNL